MTRLRSATALTSVVLLTTVAACGSPDAEDGATDGASGAYPVTVENCGAKVTFDQAPSQVVTLKSAPVPFLEDLDVLDTVTARAGAYPPGYFGQETRKELEEIPSLTDKVDASGHLQISKETVISQEPDLVLGEVENLSRETLSAVDIPLLEEPALCEETEEKPTFDSIYEQMRMYGKVFDRPKQAEQAVAGLKKRVTAATQKPGTKRTAAVLYPTVGGGATYAYGTRSMAHPQLKAAGFSNVFGDVDKRVFETSPEKLLERNPDVIILIHTDGDPAKVKQAVRDLPGASRLKAVKEDQLMAQLFNYTEPPSPLSVTGLERIVERFPS